MKIKIYIIYMFLINLLIILFLFLLSYQLFTTFHSHSNIIEGMETSTTSYAEYDTKNPDNALILSQQNAGNIAYLKQQIDDLFKMKTTVDSLSEQVTALNTQVQGIAQQQADFAQQLGGSSPPDISGTQ